MSTLKKILALSLALAMILSVSVFAGYTTDSYKDAAAIDEDAVEAVELMYALDIMTGDEKGNFNPNATITRAEVAKMIYVILNKGNDDKAATYAVANLFTDVPATAWYAGYINYLAALGLVNGSEGKFYPTNPVKTAEAAKMLLTAIGYNSEDRQYVGANWAKNVLSDASIVGLLSSTYKYGADINGAAPRQWVAVMFANALLDAYTFDTVLPSGYNGIFGSGAVAGTDKFIKFGKKYYNLYDNEVYAYATPTAYIDTIAKTTEHYASENYVLFSDGNEFKSTGLGYMDLGQKYRVIARGDKALSVRPVTSVVADATVAEITYKFEYNKGSSTRMFTIGDMTASFAGTKINAFSNYKTKDGKASAVNFTESDLIGKLDAQCNDLVRAIDRNGDGKIDYIILVYSDYAYVNKAATDKSGDYVIFGDPYTGKATTGKLWLGGAVACDEELVAGNFVKSTWNLDNGNYDLEVLPVATEVKYTKKTGIKTPVYTIGDVEYLLASKGFTNNAKMAELKNKKTNVAYDEGLAVYVGPYTFAYTDIEDIYNQLGVFVENFRMNSSIRPNRNVDGVAYYNITPELLEEELDKDCAQPKDSDKYTLFAVSVDEESGTTLTRLTAQNFLKALSADEDLVAEFKTGKGTLNGKKDSFAFINKATGNSESASKFDADAKFFVITKSGSKVVVEVKTIDEIEDKTYNNIYAELFYSPEDAKGNATIVGGLLDFRTQTYGVDNDYFFIVDALDEDGDPVVSSKTVKVNGVDSIVWNRTVRVMFSDESVDDVDLRFDSEDAATQAVLKEDALYAYKYDGDADVYTLKERQEDKNGFDFVDGKSFNDPDTTGNWEIAKDRLADFGELVFAVKNSDAKDDYSSKVMNWFDEDTVIALTVKHYSNNRDHELMSVEHYFTDIDGLAAILEEEGNLTIVNGMEVTTGEVESFTCYSDVDSRSGALLNICIYADDLWTD